MDMFRPAKNGERSSDTKFTSRMFLNFSPENLTFSKIKFILDRTNKDNRLIYCKLKANGNLLRRLKDTFCDFAGNHSKCSSI